ncbi:MAG TPA: site-specific DNA-methyltransferase [Rhodopirellula baltica]|uniref:Adenine-specific methyltransferase n=1 Tax=Rhodopirellula baltica (strain DSM 10527 / NCIMB 13988 / SH1) TaxID=243090 RepID=Q7UI69_RHOBA|nr:DNA methyltransferase [Rhodopirellula baltica]CAD77745.1 adenine-specific methyltransferase [Rhodopirellula baltica SH 1]HBE62390.1 site-specific DNA-methyltransferase [Rhodopirellula baltica]
MDPNVLKTHPAFGQIHVSDCIDGMAELPAGCIDLAFADPPFNIGYTYDVYDDSLESDEYIQWSESWIRGVHRVLADDGAFWLAIGDEYAAELKVLAQQIGFQCRSWVIWYYTFGVHCKYKFTRSHAHLFHFVKDEKHFKFNADDPSVRVPSARQLVYNDRRANSKGRMPDDTWILRPQDLPYGFTADEDIWYFPRVAGTFKERAGFHGCQMPEQLLGRIIRACSDPGDKVLDPFSGSATTVAVAKKLGREFISFEMSEEYVSLGTERLEQIRVGDPLTGAADPLRSAPATNGKKNESKAEKLAREEEERQRWATQQVGPQLEFQFETMRAMTDGELINAFREIHDGHSVDRVLLDPVLSDRLESACRRISEREPASSRRQRLIELRASGALTAEGIHTERPTTIPTTTLERFSYAAELAWAILVQRYPEHSLDDIFTDPKLLEEFDREALLHAADADPLTLRWCATQLRSWATTAREHQPGADEPEPSTPKFSAAKNWTTTSGPTSKSGSAKGGLYQVLAQDGSVLFVGETSDFTVRFGDHLASESAARFWRNEAGGQPKIRTASIQDATGPERRLAMCQWLQENPAASRNLVSLWSTDIPLGASTPS